MSSSDTNIMTAFIFLDKRVALIVVVGEPPKVILKTTPN